MLPIHPSFQGSGVYTKSVSVSGTEADRALINATMELIPYYLPAEFVPKYTFIATWNKMKYSDVEVCKK